MNIGRFIVVCFSLLGACQVNAFDVDAVLGKWTISEVYCGSCKSTDRTDIGTNITLLRDRVDNPLAGGGCPGITGYRVLPDGSTSRVAALRKLNSRWLARGKEAKAVSATCDNMDFMLFVVLADGSLVYVPEGEIVFRLGKAP